MRLHPSSLGYNQITYIPANIFSSLVNLQQLYLDPNSITYIEAGAFNGLTKMTVLYVSTPALY